MFKRHFIYLLPVLLYLSYAVFSLSKPLVTDEIDFVSAAKAITQKGVPLYYCGEHTEGHKSGLFHPPLYMYLLSIPCLVIRDANEIPCRFFGIVLNLCTFLLLYLTSTAVAVKEKLSHPRCFVYLALFLYALNPLVIQGSLLIDIDNTILNVLLLLFLYLFLSFYPDLQWWKLVILGIVFSLCLWAKLTTPWALPLCIFLFYLTNGKIKRGVTITAVITLSGVILFLSTWFIYCSACGLRSLHPLEHLLETADDIINSVIPLSLSFLVWLGRLRDIVLWISPALFLVFSLGILKTRKTIFRSADHGGIIPLLYIYAFVVFFSYTIPAVAAYNFPRYHFPLMPILCILAAHQLLSGTRIYPHLSAHWKLWLSSGIVLFSYYLFIVGDYLWLPSLPTRLLKTSPLHLEECIWKSLRDAVLYIAPVLPLYLTVRCAFRNKNENPGRKSEALTISLLLMYVASSLSLNCYHATSDYSTLYNYGETGVKKAGLFIRSISHRKDLIIAPKDVGYYANRRYYKDLVALFPGSIETVLGIEKEKGHASLEYIVLRNEGFWGIRYFPQAERYILSKYFLLKEYPHFRIYQKRQGLRFETYQDNQAL